MKKFPTFDVQKTTLLKINTQKLASHQAKGDYIMFEA